MYYHDLRDVEQNHRMPMPEFNLRVRCMLEKIKLETGEVAPIDPSEIHRESFQSTTKGTLQDILNQMAFDNYDKET